MKIAVACDHSGLELKALAIEIATKLGHSCIDFGTDTEESCSYADYGYKAAKAIVSCESDRGVVVCGTGIGISIASNKVHGIRCAVCGDGTSARLTREHNDANMLALGSRLVGPEMARDIIEIFLTTEFSEGERHIMRIGHIADIEKKESL